MLDVWVIGLEPTSHFIVIQQRRPGRIHRLNINPVCPCLFEILFCAWDEIWIAVLGDGGSSLYGLSKGIEVPKRGHMASVETWHQLMPSFCHETCSLVLPGYSSLNCHLVSAVPIQPLDACDNNVLITQDSLFLASSIYPGLICCWHAAFFHQNVGNTKRFRTWFPVLSYLMIL